ncbi:MAG: M48 family metallopeptidase [Candidatus Omnitrophica bacterium]|nr:M48 family metallopeptidase [Candidatus Omnitrophota bacterium]
MKALRRTISIALISAMFLSGCATVPITGRKQLVLIPHSELQALSADNYRQIVAESKLSSNKQDIKTVQNIGRKIALSTENFLRENGMSNMLGYFAWEFTLIEDETANAFALPGGKVAVYSGILKYTQNEDGLAVVIAHEAAHVIANHGGERLSQMMLAQFGHTMLTQALEEKTQTTKEFLMLAYGVSMNLGIVLPYSRLHEKEADRIGLILMAQAGYNPREAIPFWERMNNAGKGARNLEFLSTHPAPETRINDIKTYLPEALKHFNKLK